jgi:hypothetical protein
LRFRCDYSRVEVAPSSLVHFSLILSSSNSDSFSETDALITQKTLEKKGIMLYVRTKADTAIESLEVDDPKNLGKSEKELTAILRKKTVDTIRKNFAKFSKTLQFEQNDLYLLNNHAFFDYRKKKIRFDEERLKERLVSISQNRADGSRGKEL